MKLFHVSDIHFGAEDPLALNWFAERVAAEKPDAVIMTGDLTMRARAAEFRAGGEWLAGLGVPVTVEIGNHDIPYYWSPLARLVRPYARYLRVERMIERELALPGVTIVPLRTVSRLQWRVNQSKGKVSRRSLSEALAMVAKAPAGGLVLVAAHHPLTDADTQSTGSTAGGGEALAKLATAGAHAVLTGHVHDPFDLMVERGGHQIRLIGAGTLSRRTRRTPPAFNELRLLGGARFETVVRTFARD